MNGNVYKRKDGRYEARIPLGNNDEGKRLYRSFYGKTRKEAEEKLRNFQNHTGFAYNLTEMTVKALVDEYLNNISFRLKESSLANYCMKIKKHILPCFGGSNCNLVKPTNIQDFIEQKLKSGLSPRYVADIIILLKSVFRYGNRVYGLKNPADGIVMPKRAKPEITILNSAEQARLLASINGIPDLTSIGITLALYTGIRIGELCALQWKDIDLDNRIINVKKTIQRIQSDDSTKKTKVVISEPKSQSSVRIIPVPDCLMDMLEKFKENENVYILSGTSKFVEPRTLQYRFAKILKKANLPSVHFHSLRHAFATNCIALGFDVKTLSEILGHSSVDITLNRYVHSSLDRKKACMRLLKLVA
ncbi:site-specific integrase [Ruminococcus sp.]|uniref:site-specific integrase n=1 Tax=Ruminococcus sp. TaxID=41978 RepID=UPI0025E1FCB2|nr:site-specific integrase [Ruminococcus sp.]MBR1432372.1 site-specific integrase [Ruminococcus sp.]